MEGEDVLVYEKGITELPFAHFTWAREHIAIPTLPSFSPYDLLYMFKILQIKKNICEKETHFKDFIPQSISKKVT